MPARGFFPVSSPFTFFFNTVFMPDETCLKQLIFLEYRKSLICPLNYGILYKYRGFSNFTTIPYLAFVAFKENSPYLFFTDLAFIMV